MTFPYVASPDKLKSLVDKLAGDVGIPAKFDTKFLKSIGFTSSNDTRLLSAIKFVGLAEENGTPTKLWKALRGDSKSAMASGVRQGYGALFDRYPDAHLKDDEALRTYFAAETALGGQAVAKTVRTFKAFCELSDFSQAGVAGTANTSAPKASSPNLTKNKEETALDAGVSGLARQASGPGGLTVNLNIQLQLPADSSGDVYDKFFEAMRKNFWPSQQ